jgi:hypothetical protein
MHLVVYRKDNPFVLWGRFGLYANAVRFAMATSKEFGTSEFVIFDTEKWQVVHIISNGEKRDA